MFTDFFYDFSHSKTITNSILSSSKTFKSGFELNSPQILSPTTSTELLKEASQLVLNFKILNTCFQIIIALFWANITFLTSKL